MEWGFILLGITLSDLKVKSHLKSSHCLWNASIECDLSILQILVVFVCNHMLFDSPPVWFRSNSYLTFSSVNMLNVTVIWFHAFRAGHSYPVLPLSIHLQYHLLKIPCQPPAPTVAHRVSCHILSKQKDVMRGCECCGQVPGELEEQSSGVRDGSMTMCFLAKFYCVAREEICCLMQVYTLQRG